ncbi:hypothetical protein OKW43_003405 [Paraburkholderia sp. WC7.3g]
MSECMNCLNQKAVLGTKGIGGNRLASNTGNTAQNAMGAVPASFVASKRVTAIKALSLDRSHLAQRAWIGKDVPLYGYR